MLVLCVLYVRARACVRMCVHARVCAHVSVYVLEYLVIVTDMASVTFVINIHI